jgi:hypothetical protein
MLEWSGAAGVCVDRGDETLVRIDLRDG